MGNGHLCSGLYSHSLVLSTQLHYIACGVTCHVAQLVVVEMVGKVGIVEMAEIVGVVEIVGMV